MKQYTYTTAYKTLLGDLHTPVTTYLKVRDLFPQSVLMESSDYHGVENNRSFIGLNPIASISISHGPSVTEKLLPSFRTVSKKPKTSMNNTGWNRSSVISSHVSE